MMNFFFKTASRVAARPFREAAFPSKSTINPCSVLSKRWTHNVPLTYDFVREKIMLVCRLYDKIDPYKITLDSHFVNDLGLDSLDHTELIMALEDEFNFEIPDKDAEKLMRPADILRYISDKEEAYELLQELQAHHHHDAEHGDHGHEDRGHGPHGKVETHHCVSAKGLADEAFNIPKRDFSTSSRRFLDESNPDAGKWPTSFDVPLKDPPNFDDIQARVLKVCSKYDKIDSSQLQLTSHFVDDLGLDSLDHVEIMMELEDEFGMEIPDQEAEKLMRITEIARYIFQREEANLPKPEYRPF